LPPPLQIIAPRGSRDSTWLALRQALWPEVPQPAQLAGMADALARGHFVRLAHSAGKVMGFVEAARRVDYVNGTDSSPVAFVEGLLVVPEFRRRGVARALMGAVIEWARGQGLSELASDALLDNTEGHAAHRALGFEETERVVYFRRSLQDA
jgi:aminoglycoside 6'-N-acetyltransferase I